MSKHRGKSLAPRMQSRSQQSSVSKAQTKVHQGGPLYPRELRAIVGTHAINEALAVSPRSITMAWLDSNFKSSSELRELEEKLQELKVKIELKPPAMLEKLARTHQGAAIFSNKTPHVDWEKIYAQDSGIVLFLDGIEDPHNLGAILRTAWLMKVAAVVVPQDRAAGLTGTVHKVACGGVEHVPVQSMSNFSNQLEVLKKNGFWVYGLSHLGKGDLFSLKLPKKVVWMVGAEDKGLRTTSERVCDELVRIPQVSAAASYNASVAAAIALTETTRQLSL